MSRATVRTILPDAERAAAAVRPDNTPEVTTRVEDGAVVTTIDRPTTGGLRATLDDYLVNLAVARRVGGNADARTDRQPGTTDDTDPDRQPSTTDDTHTDTP